MQINNQNELFCILFAFKRKQHLCYVMLIQFYGNMLEGNEISEIATMIVTNVKRLNIMWGIKKNSRNGDKKKTLYIHKWGKMNNIFRTKALTHEQKIENKRNVQKTMFNKNATQKKRNRIWKKWVPTKTTTTTHHNGF